MKKINIILLFLIISILSFTKEIYPKELDLKNTPISDVLAHLSKYSKYTYIGDSAVSDLNVDMYFRKGTDISDILETIEITYGLTKIKNKETIIFRGKRSENTNILVGRVVDKNTNKEIEGVNIVLKKKENLETYSGHFGEYILDGILEGVYFISILSEEYIFDADFIEIKSGVNRFDFYVEKIFKNVVKETKKDRYKKKSKEIAQIGEKNDIIENILLENINSKEIEKIIKEMYGENLKSSISEDNNSVILLGNRDYVESARKLILNLDKRKKQIRVTAEIIDVRENLFEELGFNWAYDSQGGISDNTGLKIGTFVSNAIDGFGSVMGNSLNFVSAFNNEQNVLDLTLNMLETTQDLKVNALPSIVLLNREEGILKMTEEVIVGENRDEDTDTNKINYTPIFKEAGIILKVLPSIKEDSSIYLDLNLEVSDFNLKQSVTQKAENSGTYNSEGGSKVSRNLKTRIRLKNNDVILIGGLKRKINQKINNKVPILGNIPAVGVLFRNKSTRTESMDLYIKIKAEIIEEI